MVKPYSLDLRERVAAAVNRDGMSRQEAARHFGVAAITAITWVKRLSETGSLATGQIGGHRPKKIQALIVTGFCSDARSVSLRFAA